MDWVDMIDKTEKIRENWLRGEAAHFGIRMTKSRGALSLDNHGGYMLVNASRNAVVIGSRFNAYLYEVEAFLAKLSQQSGFKTPERPASTPKNVRYDSHRVRSVSIKQNRLH
jgi:hypothetical protein